MPRNIRRGKRGCRGKLAKAGSIVTVSKVRRPQRGQQTEKSLHRQPRGKNANELKTRRGKRPEVSVNVNRIGGERSRSKLYVRG